MSLWEAHNLVRLLSYFGRGGGGSMLLPSSPIQILSEKYSESKLIFPFFIPLRMPKPDKVGNRVIIFGCRLLSFTD